MGETTDGQAQVSVPDDMAISMGFTPAPAPTETKMETQTVAEPTKIETTTQSATPAESASPKPEAQPAVSESGKPFYTPEEVAQILKEEATTGKVLLDSNRLTPEGKLLQKSFQQGYGPKFEQAKRMREEAEHLRAEIEQRQREAENQRVFQKEAEELGEEEASRRKEIRELREGLQRLEWERNQAKQRELSMLIQNNFRQAAPQYYIPQEPVYEDIALAYQWTNDLQRVQNGEQPSTPQEGAARFADAIGLTNLNNLRKLVKANPANYEAFKNEIINEYNKARAAGPTVPTSTSGAIPDKQIVEKVDPNKSLYEDVLEQFGGDKNIVFTK